MKNLNLAAILLLGLGACAQDAPAPLETCEACDAADKLADMKSPKLLPVAQCQLTDTQTVDCFDSETVELVALDVVVSSDFDAEGVAQTIESTTTTFDQTGAATVELSDAASAADATIDATIQFRMLEFPSLTRVAEARLEDERLAHVFAKDELWRMVFLTTDPFLRDQETISFQTVVGDQVPMEFQYALGNVRTPVPALVPAGESLDVLVGDPNDPTSFRTTKITEPGYYVVQSDRRLRSANEGDLDQ